MLRQVATTSFINTILNLLQSPWGRRWVQEVGAVAIERWLLSYLDPTSTDWREQRMKEVADVAMKVSIPFLCDPTTPRYVRRSILNMLHAFDGVTKRREITQQYGCKVPAFFVLNITDECGMGCPVCYMDSKIRGSTLPLWALDRIVAEMKRNFGIHFVVVSGGEPFQKKAELFALARLHRDVTFLVYTNGTKITARDVRILALLGNIVPAISLEGYEAETDSRRGKGYFRNMTELMRALRQAGVLFGFSATVMRHNAGVLGSDEFIEFCIAQGCKFGWYFIYVPIGRGADCNLMVTTPQRSELSSQVFKWLAQGRPIIIGDFWNGGPLVNGCIAGKYYFVVEADGSFGPCVFMPVSLKDTIYDIFAGRSRYPSIKAALLTSPTFIQCRRNQGEIIDYTQPCQVIGHPEMACEVCRQIDARANPKKTPLGFFNPDGEIQRFLAENAEEWSSREREPHLIGSPYYKQPEA